eukprot:4016451-Lingulodinium_polyedra.AAC.1
MNVHERKALPPSQLGSLCSGSATFGGSLVGGLVIAAAHGDPPGGPPSGSEVPKFAVEDAVEFRF